MLSRMKPALEGHDVVMNVPPGLPPVLLDAVQIEQVVTNPSRTPLATPRAEPRSL